MSLVSALFDTFALIFLGAISLTIAHQSETGRLPRSNQMGIRTTETKKSDRAWEQAHKKAAPLLRYTAYISFLCAAVSLLEGILTASVRLRVITFALTWALVIVFFAYSALTAHRVAKRINQSGG
ncbi:hypothetical protein GP475_00305 [Corynebacterium poyangense]|uniref:SdpI family protein n=1 Tax=Corynebacterium poyangense TaxID=2684405 RepID=A0A7H0SL16_9CORY|nr:SdpI family protein [Corynebacterium poyangense]QNQ89241.1 hypothetical protein GP475_00305 [Corynebacterium poyangense]